MGYVRNGGAYDPESPVDFSHGLQDICDKAHIQGSQNITRWADRIELIDVNYAGKWELPALGVVTAPTAVLIRPDGYVAWVGGLTQSGLADALTTWFGPPTAAQPPVSKFIL